MNCGNTYLNEDLIVAVLISLLYVLFVSRAKIVCYTAVFSVVTQGSLRDDSKNGCVAD